MLDLIYGLFEGISVQCLPIAHTTKVGEGNVVPPILQRYNTRACCFLRTCQVAEARGEQDQEVKHHPKFHELSPSELLWSDEVRVGWKVGKGLQLRS